MKTLTLLLFTSILTLGPTLTTLWIYYNINIEINILQNLTLIYSNIYNMIIGDGDIQWYAYFIEYLNWIYNSIFNNSYYTKIGENYFFLINQINNNNWEIKIVQIFNNSYNIATEITNIIIQKTIKNIHVFYNFLINYSGITLLLLIIFLVLIYIVIKQNNYNLRLVAFKLKKNGILGLKKWTKRILINSLIFSLLHLLLLHYTNDILWITQFLLTNDTHYYLYILYFIPLDHFYNNILNSNLFRNISEMIKYIFKWDNNFNLKTIMMNASSHEGNENRSPELPHVETMNWHQDDEPFSGSPIETQHSPEPSEYMEYDEDDPENYGYDDDYEMSATGRSTPSEFSLNMENEFRHEDPMTNPSLTQQQPYYDEPSPAPDRTIEFEMPKSDVKVEYQNRTVIHRSKMILTVIFDTINSTGQKIATGVHIIAKEGAKIVYRSQENSNVNSEVHEIITRHWRDSQITHERQKKITYLNTPQGKLVTDVQDLNPQMDPEDQIRQQISRSLSGLYRNRTFGPRFRITQSDIDLQSNAESIPQTHYSAIPEEDLIITPYNQHSDMNQNRTDTSSTRQSFIPSKEPLVNYNSSEMNIINYFFKFSWLLVNLLFNVNTTNNIFIQNIEFIVQNNTYQEFVISLFLIVIAIIILFILFITNLLILIFREKLLTIFTNPYIHYLLKIRYSILILELIIIGILIIIGLLLLFIGLQMLIL